MEWFGIVALLLLLCYSAYPGKVKRLETRGKDCNYLLQDNEREMMNG
ncbi:MAG: hypothetical protein ACLU00_01760 [Mediterraneibacter faecis]